MIYNFFNGTITHLSPRIVENICIYANSTNVNGIKDHYFYIILYQELSLSSILIDLYESIFKKYSMNNYRFILNEEEINNILKNEISKEDVVYFHSSIPSFKINKIYLKLIIDKKILQCSLICWGMNDLKYEYKNSIKNAIMRLYLYYVFLKMKKIIVLSEGDLEATKLLYPRIKCILSPYVIRDEQEDNRDILIRKKTTKTLKIMISHSGWPHNNHLMVFMELERYKDEDIEIICPLCYGEKQYIDDVILTGKKIFGKKFGYFTDIKTRNEYNEILSEVDIYISAAEIQTGLYALGKMLATGKKVFITGNLMYSMNQNGFIVNETKNIIKLKYEEFSKLLSDDEAKKNHDLYHQKYANVESRLLKWRELYAG